LVLSSLLHAVKKNIIVAINAMVLIIVFISKNLKS
jgi:hypothetical protein